MNYSSLRKELPASHTELTIIGSSFSQPRQRFGVHRRNFGASQPSRHLVIAITYPSRTIKLTSALPLPPPLLYPTFQKGGISSNVFLNYFLRRRRTSVPGMPAAINAKLVNSDTGVAWCRRRQQEGTKPPSLLERRSGRRRPRLSSYRRAAVVERRCHVLVIVELPRSPLVYYKRRPSRFVTIGFGAHASARTAVGFLHCCSAPRCCWNVEPNAVVVFFTSVAFHHVVAGFR